MGVLTLFSSCSHPEHAQKIGTPTVREAERRLGNPNPRRFTINKILSVRRFVIVSVHYPDCQNYEGAKILVFENVSVKAIRNLRYLDPHFCESKSHLSPIARFAPTEEGWGNAALFCTHA